MGRAAESSADNFSMNLITRYRKERWELPENMRRWQAELVAAKLGAVKIGRSLNPEKRLRAIKNGNPDILKLLGIINDDREIELHQRFAEYRTSGEWFSLGAGASGLLGSGISMPVGWVKWLTSSRSKSRSLPAVPTF
jgi:hypothetical protein